MSKRRKKGVAFFLLWVCVVFCVGGVGFGHVFLVFDKGKQPFPSPKRKFLIVPRGAWRDRKNQVKDCWREKIFFGSGRFYENPSSSTTLRKQENTCKRGENFFRTPWCTGYDKANPWCTGYDKGTPMVHGLR
jgi:hypothetical protein